MTRTTTAMAFAAVVTVMAGAAVAQTLHGPDLPDALRRAAIATRSDSTGEIAGARIGDTGIWVVYIRTANGCGSGGCRAQIWRAEGGRFVQSGILPVGRLPLVSFPQTSNGMPVLGVTVRQGTGSAVLPVEFDGSSWTSQAEGSLPAGSGRSLITQAMLRRF